ncbi:MAG: hypothetical protein ACI8P9_005701 [Parasphingorhabdus sp.]|jgi:hypothetical protein
MISDNNNKPEAQPDLTVLAAEWMAMLEYSCPEDWRQLLPTLDLKKPDRMLIPKALPVLSFLPQMADLAPTKNRPLVNELIRLQPELHFNQTYSAEDFGAEFLQQYGWIKFLGPDAYWHSYELSSGLVLFGDDVTYPDHWHVAEELYFPVSGTADWYHEEKGWQLLSPGALVQHASNIKHSMRTRGEPLLALYIWRGGDLVQKSSINEDRI